MYLIEINDGYGIESHFFNKKENAIAFALKQFNDLVEEDGGIEEWEEKFGGCGGYTKSIQKIYNYDYDSDYLEMTVIQAEDE